LLESKALAARQRAEEVLTIHVDQALEEINRERTQSGGRQLLTLIGGALFGAFIPGFVTELTAAKPHVVPIAIYTGLGLVGMLLVFMGLRR